MSDVINNEDLTTLTGKQHDGWVVNAQQKNSREDVFLDDLQIDKFEFDELFEIFESLDTAIGILDEDEDTNDDYEEEINSYNEIKSWFEQKDDKWIKQFYSLLSEDKDNSWNQLNFPFVRINSVDGIKHVSGDSAYFESSIQGNFENIATISTVKREVYTKDKANKNFDENVVSFLKSIGVRPFDEKVAIELRLEFYKSTPPKLITEQYYDDIKWFIGYWKENRTDIVYYQRKVEELFEPVRFLLGVSNDSIYWKTATEICLDSPIMETGLSELVAIHEKYPIFDGYSEKLTIEELKDFVRFLKAIGVMYQLEITHLNKYPALHNPNNPYIWNKCNWTETGHIEDYSIKNLVYYLRENSVLASRLVWNAIINSDNRRVQVAGFQPNRTHDYKEVDSFLIYMLKNYDWIPTKSGEFRNPRAMTRDDLPDDFPFNNSNGLLTAIEFGHNEKNRLEQQRKLREQESEEYKQIDSLAKKIGLDSGDKMRESAEFYKKMKSQGKLDEIKKLLDSEQPDFSEDSSSNPSRRFEKLKEDAINSPKKLKEMRQRSVSDGEYEKVKQKAKEYLKDRYTINDVLYCQICKKEMPFKLSDGSYYFEAVSLINDAEKSFIYNFIALCPVDAAKFKFANTSRNNMKTLIKEIIENRTPEEINNNENGKNYIELVLADNSEVIEFTPKHLGDIKSTLDD